MAEKEFSLLQNRINGLLLDFSLAFHVPCYFYDIAGRQLGSGGYNSRSNFCRVIHFFDSKQVCHQSYLQNCIYAEEKKSPYTCFCPFGLVNITIPILNGNITPCFITVGPLLFSKPDDLMLNNILHQNYTLKPRYREIRQRLGEIEVKTETEIQAMLGVIDSAVKGILLSTFPATTIEEETEKPIGKDMVKDELATWFDEYVEKNHPEESSFDMEIIGFPKSKMKTLAKKDLEHYTMEISDAVFAERTFDLMKYKAMKYVEALMALSQDADISLELIFNAQCIDVEKFIHCNTVEELSILVGNMGDRFTQVYLSSKELTNKDIIFQAMNFIRSHYSDITLIDVAENVGLSPPYFSSLFKKETGLSYTNYLNRIRIAESKRLLRQGKSIVDIALSVGYSDQSYFSTVFRKCEGIPPKSWQNAHQD